MNSPDHAASGSVAVVIPTHNRKGKLKRLLQSLATSSLLPNRIIVVADRCTDGTPQMLKQEFPDVDVLISDLPLHCSGGRAAGLARVSDDYVFFVDDDNIVEHTCLHELVTTMNSCPALGLLGPLMLSFPPGSGVWCAGGEFTRVGVRHRLAVPDRGPDALGPSVTRCDFLPNAFLARRSVLVEDVPFDPAAFPHNWAEADMGVRMVQAGYCVATAHRARVWHDAGYSGQITRIGVWEVEDQARSRVLIRRRFPQVWGPMLGFWALTFPVSTAYYVVRFLRTGRFVALVRAYIRGTVRGLTMPVAGPRSD